MIKASGNTQPVVCGIIERGPRFLAALRGPGQTNAALWEFPGGKLRHGETADAALKRELHEELSIEVDVTARLSEHIHIYPSLTIRLIPFLCVIIKGKPYPREHSCIKWLFLHKAQSLAWSPADIPVLTEYLNRKLSSDHRAMH